MIWPKAVLLQRLRFRGLSGVLHNHLRVADSSRDESEPTEPLHSDEGERSVEAKRFPMARSTRGSGDRPPPVRTACSHRVSDDERARVVTGFTVIGIFGMRPPVCRASRHRAVARPRYPLADLPTPRPATTLAIEAARTSECTHFPSAAPTRRRAPQQRDCRTGSRQAVAAGDAAVAASSSPRTGASALSAKIERSIHTPTPASTVPSPVRPTRSLPRERVSGGDDGVVLVTRLGGHSSPRFPEDVRSTRGFRLALCATARDGQRLTSHPGGG